LKRVVVTGIGIVSCIGNTIKDVTDSLYNAKSGITFSEEYEKLGFRSHVYGKPQINLEEKIDRKALRFMGDGAAFNHISMEDAIRDAKLSENQVSNIETGIIMGSGGPSTKNIVQASETLKIKGAKKVSPFMVPRAMSSTNSATLATYFKIKGVNYSISSACSTSAHCIGNAYELIQIGKQKIIFAGGGEELDPTLSVLFDAMGALSSKYNSEPEKASRAYDKDRDGFIISGGAGVLVMEELESALKRSAKIYAEIVGYGANSDGYDMVQPSGEGAVRCMKLSLNNLNFKIDYINTHGTSTPIGDIKEIEAMKELFKEDMPPFSSTKSLTGHSLGGTGVQEAIYSILMMNNNFISKSANIENLDPEVEGLPIVLETKKDCDFDTLLSNSFGFGGTNASLVFKKFDSEEKNVFVEKKIDVENELKGKKGIIFGVANDHSCAWGIANGLLEKGGELCITYQNDLLKKRVENLCKSKNVTEVYKCDVSESNDIENLYKKIKNKWGKIDFIVHSIAFSDRNELAGKYLNTSKDNFLNTMLISCYSFTEIAQKFSDIINSNGSLLTLTYFGSQKVIPNYNVMGVAKAALETSIKYLAVDLGDKKIRVNGISLGPMRTLSGAAIKDSRYIYNWTEKNNPLGKKIDFNDLSGASNYLLSNQSSGVTGEIHYVDAGYNIIGMIKPPKKSLKS
jgi:3-oxoacyl-[acyl-carrier-protein] synthase-1